MKAQQLFICLAIASFALLGTPAKGQESRPEVQMVKPQTILLSFGAQTRGFSLSYEHIIYRDHYSYYWGSLKGFLGYGFNSSNWDEVEDKERPGALPKGRSWRTATYDPFHEHQNPNRALYYLGDLKEYSLGLEFNNMVGKKHHFFEFGLGISLDYFNRKVNFYRSRHELGQAPTYDQLMKAKGSRWAFHSHAKLGYRYIATNGLTLATGISGYTLEGMFTYFYATDDQIGPFLSVGYSF